MMNDVRCMCVCGVCWVVLRGLCICSLVVDSMCLVFEDVLDVCTCMHTVWYCRVDLILRCVATMADVS